jgi:hypothetical protein
MMAGWWCGAPDELRVVSLVDDEDELAWGSIER